jgi:hypothetical protein
LLSIGRQIDYPGRLPRGFRRFEKIERLICHGSILMAIGHDLKPPVKIVRCRQG